MAQKMLLLLMLMAVVIVSGCATAPTRGEVVRAAIEQHKEQSPAPDVTFTLVGCKGGGPKYFNSATDCERAMQSGECSYYTPSYTEGRGKNPVDGKKIFLVPVEEPVCVKTLTVKGVYWVAEPSGTEFRFRRENGGTFSTVPYALHACGNRVMDIIYPQPKKIVSSAAVPPQPEQARNVCAENGFYGEQYFPGFQGGEPVCFEKLPWYAWENLKTPVYVATGVLAVGAVVYCAKTHRCRSSPKRQSSPPSSPPPSSPPPSGPVGSPPIGGPIGSNPFGGPVGSLPIF